jgi:hypothetical protein
MQGATGATRAAHQNKVADVVLTGVAGTLEAVNGEEVDAHLLRRESVAHGGALVDDVALRDGGLAGRLVGLDELDDGAG